MTKQPSKDALIEIGRRGGSFDTNSMTSTQRQQVDRYVSEGKKDTNR